MIVAAFLFSAGSMWNASKGHLLKNHNLYRGIYYDLSKDIHWDSETKRYEINHLCFRRSLLYSRPLIMHAVLYLRQAMLLF